MRSRLRLLPRSVKHFVQRRRRGFDDTVTWDLGNAAAQWLLPRLKRFKEVGMVGCPGEYCPIPDYTSEQFEDGKARWEADIDAMIRALDLLANEHEMEEPMFTDEHMAEIERGLALLAKGWRNLWW